MGSTHVVVQLSFSMFFSILTFDFDFIFGSFLTFWGPNGLFLGLGKGSNTVLGSTHVVEQLSFSVSTQLQQWLFCCWDCGCCWAVTIFHQQN